ncbi:MAG: hypothetical protein SGPRY_012900 [Prymnesium sp.]
MGLVLLRLLLFTVFTFAIIRVAVIFVYVVLCLCCVRQFDPESCAHLAGSSSSVVAHAST